MKARSTTRVAAGKLLWRISEALAKLIKARRPVTSRYYREIRQLLARSARPRASRKLAIRSAPLDLASTTVTVRGEPTRNLGYVGVVIRTREKEDRPTSRANFFL